MIPTNPFLPGTSTLIAPGWSARSTKKSKLIPPSRIVHVFRLAEPKVQKREAMITNLSFLDRGQLVALRDNLETWSQLCVDSLDRLLAR
jgi:hypothetical protein